jgi:hypothetical protein
MTDEQNITMDNDRGGRISQKTLTTIGMDAIKKSETAAVEQNGQMAFEAKSLGKAVSGGNEGTTDNGSQINTPSVVPTALPSFETAKFNIGEFRLTQSFAENLGGQKLLTTVPVRKPLKESWFRTHPDEKFRLSTAVIELKERGETYLITRNLWSDLVGEATFVAKIMIPTLTRQGDLLLWPIRLPGPDGNLDEWNQSAMEAAAIAREKWVRMCAKRSLGAYEIIVAPEPQVPVVWPEVTLEEVIRIAFKGKIIGSLDHPIVRQLRGQS